MVKKRTFTKRLINTAGRFICTILKATSHFMTAGTINVAGAVMGNIGYYCSARHRRVALDNLRHAFGDKYTEKERMRIAKNVFIHFSCMFFDFFRCFTLNDECIEKMVELEGCKHLDEVLKNGNGSILMTAHYGNWEISARKLVLQGYKVNVIARGSDDLGSTGIVNDIRKKSGYKVFDRSNSMFGVVRALKNNEAVAILPDQNFYNGVFVDFFGRPASTATGLVVLSLKSHARILPVFCHRLPNGSYKMTIYPPIEFTPSGDENKDIKNLTQIATKVIEDEIRKDPSQWLWIHNRWKLTHLAPKDE